MYLNLFHNGKKYIYETGNKLNIGHLKEISEGILKSNKNIMQIIYDNPSTYHKYINPNDNTFLRDLIPKGKTRAKFSIKLGSGNPGSNSNDIKVLQKSADTEKGIGDISQKNFFGNFSYMYTAQKKFNMMITNKFNEMLLELRELIRRINEVYDEIYKNFAQSNINYNQEVTKSNKNDLSNKMKQITEYEFHIIKFFEKEKLFYEKLNAVMRHCLMEQNGKIVVSNKTMKDLYKNMFTDSNNNIKVDLNEKNEYISNIIENPFMKGENNSKKKNSSNLSLEDELFHDKIFKKKSKQFLHSLSSLNIDNHNNNLNRDFSYNNLNNKNNSNFNFNPNNEFSENKSNINIPNLKTNKTLNRNNTLSTNNNKIRQSKLMISTEIGPDGVQRGKIVLFSEDKKSKKDLEGKDNKEKSDKTKEENESGNNENNSANLDLIKSRLSFRNRKGFGLPSFKTNLNINKNLNLFPIEEKDDKKRLNTNNQKNTGTNMNKNSNEENNKNNKKDPKNPDVANENISDSTEYLHKEKNKNKEKSKKDLTNEDNKDKDSKNQDKDKNGNNNDPNNQNDKNKENNNDPNSNNKITDGALLALNNNNNENIDSENASKKEKKPKKERKKRKNSSEDNSSEDEDDKEKKKEKKKRNSEGGDSKESERSKKSSTKDLFDLHLLRNLAVDKDNPYKKPSYPVYGTGLKKVKENTLIRPEIPESDDSEEEKKKLALVKKKKKNHIKNKYDFLI